MARHNTFCHWLVCLIWIKAGLTASTGEMMHMLSASHESHHSLCSYFKWISELKYCFAVPIHCQMFVNIVYCWLSMPTVFPCHYSSVYRNLQCLLALDLLKNIHWFKVTLWLTVFHRKHLDFDILSICCRLSGFARLIIHRRMIEDIQPFLGQFFLANYCLCVPFFVKWYLKLTTSS